MVFHDVAHFAGITIVDGRAGARVGHALTGPTIETFDAIGLSRSGRIFLAGCFAGRRPIADIRETAFELAQVGNTGPDTIADLAVELQALGANGIATAFSIRLDGARAKFVALPRVPARFCRIVRAIVVWVQAIGDIAAFAIDA